jgi:hypothetical protein
MDVWVAYQQIYEVDPAYGPPFSNSQDLYNTIDSTTIGDVAWQAFSVKFSGKVPNATTGLSWKRKSYEVWFRDPLKIAEAQIANKNYGHEMDYAPKCSAAKVQFSSVQ